MYGGPTNIVSINGAGNMLGSWVYSAYLGLNLTTSSPTPSGVNVQVDNRRCGCARAAGGVRDPGQMLQNLMQMQYMQKLNVMPPPGGQAGQGGWDPSNSGCVTAGRKS